MRVPGVITRVHKTEDSNHYTGEESTYVLYTIAHHACQKIHGFWFNDEKFTLTGNADFVKDDGSGDPIDPVGTPTNPQTEVQTFSGLSFENNVTKNSGVLFASIGYRTYEWDITREGFLSTIGPSDAGGFSTITGAITANDAATSYFDNPFFRGSEGLYGEDTNVNIQGVNKLGWHLRSNTNKLSLRIESTDATIPSELSGSIEVKYGAPNTSSTGTGSTTSSPAGPIGGSRQTTSAYGPFKFTLVEKETHEDYKKLNRDYTNKMEIYANLTGNNRNNELIPGLDGVVPNSELPVSWICIRVRDERTFWSKPEVGFRPTSATFEITGTDRNAATAMKEFMHQHMGVARERGGSNYIPFDDNSLQRSVDICNSENRHNDCVYRHSERESMYRSFLQAFDGAVYYDRDGTLHMVPDTLNSESFLITEEMCTVPIEHKPKGTLLDYANTVQAEINNEENEWKKGHTGEIRNDPAINEDGMQYVNNVGTLRCITNLKRAREYLTKQLARIGQYSELQLVIFPGQYEKEVNIVEGNYVFELTVTDEDGNENTVQKTISI